MQNLEPSASERTLYPLSGYINMHVCIYVNVFIHTYLCIYLCLYICTSVWKYTTSDLKKEGAIYDEDTNLLFFLRM